MVDSPSAAAGPQSHVERRWPGTASPAASGGHACGPSRECCRHRASRLRACPGTRSPSVLVAEADRYAYEPSRPVPGLVGDYLCLGPLRLSGKRYLHKVRIPGAAPSLSALEPLVVVEDPELAMATVHAKGASGGLSRCSTTVKSLGRGRALSGLAVTSWNLRCWSWRGKVERSGRGRGRDRWWSIRPSWCRRSRMGSGASRCRC
jgi:hypothetical protein